MKSNHVVVGERRKKGAVFMHADSRRKISSNDEVFDSLDKEFGKRDYREKKFNAFYGIKY